MPRILILGYEGVYGLADMVRAIWHYRRLCAAGSCELYLDLRNHPIGEFYTTRLPPPGLAAERVPPDRIESYLEDPSRDFCIYSCSNQYPKQIPEALRDLRDYIQPAAILRERVQSLLRSSGLVEDRFVSLHIRCGDKYLPETRLRDLDFHAETPIQSNIRGLLQRREREFPGVPIVLHCDAAGIREALAHEHGFVTLPIEPVHTGFHTGDLSQLLDSVAEFHVIGAARRVFAFKTFSVVHPGSLRTSGYPMWSARLHGKAFEAI